MMAITWTTTSSSASAKKRFERLQEENHEVRVAMNTMVRDISLAYLSGNNPLGTDETTKPRTQFIGKSASPVDELRFSTLAHQVLWANANESEQTVIAYSAEPDRDDPGKTNLLRRELRRLPDESWDSETAEVDVLLRDIERVEFEYFDWRDDEWKEEWNSINADAEKHRLPERVRITVTLKTDSGDSIKRTTQARISMLERLQF
jgi:hypothetical protein